MEYELTTPKPFVPVKYLIYILQEAPPIVALIRIICWSFTRVVTNLHPFEPFDMELVSLLTSIIN